MPLTVLLLLDAGAYCVLLDDDGAFGDCVPGLSDEPIGPVLGGEMGVTFEAFNVGTPPVLVDPLSGGRTGGGVRMAPTVGARGLDVVVGGLLVVLLGG